MNGSLLVSIEGEPKSFLPPRLFLIMKVVDDFLKQNDFDFLQSQLIGQDQIEFPWFYSDSIDHLGEEKNKFQFTHTFYNSNRPTSSFFREFESIFEKVYNQGILARAKANLLTRTQKIIENTFHTDFDVIWRSGYPTKPNDNVKQITTAILYVNTNNGYTKFEDGTKVESVANRLVTFPANIKHKGTSCTDEKIRVVINFNYIIL